MRKIFIVFCFMFCFLVSCSGKEKLPEGSSLIYLEFNDNYMLSLEGVKEKNIKLPNQTDDGIHGKKDIYLVIAKIDDQVESIVFPDSALAIDASSSEASNLKEVHFGKKLEQISGAFKHLQKISLAKANPNFTLVDGVLYSKDLKKLVLYPADKFDKAFTLPVEVEDISSGAFLYNNYLEKLTFNKPLHNVYTNALSYMKELNEIVGADGLETIGVLDHNPKLTTITNLGIIKYIPDNFLVDTNVTEITIPKTITRIGKHAFGRTKEEVKIENIYFKGTEEQWLKLVENVELFLDDVTIHFNA